MRRFYTESKLITKSLVTISGPEVNHIRKALRLEIDELIEVFDGTGTVYLAKIQSMDKRKIDAQIINFTSAQQTPPYLYVGQALLKSKKMDFLYQKLTELSVEGLYPFSSQFSNAKVKRNKHNERWQRISLEACKQCKRPTKMQCFTPLSFENLLAKSADFDTKILFWENEDSQFLSSLPELQNVKAMDSTIILLGPEGGFSSSEVQQAKAKGFTTVSLGPQILRAETAALAAASIVQHLLGNLSRTNTINWDSPS